MIGATALTSRLFEKSLKRFLSESEIFFYRNISSSKTIVLLLTVVKSSVSNGLTINFLRAFLHHRRTLVERLGCFRDGFYT